ncbi:ankyrin repeat-containing domain protein [Massariosphaeria phaeospora]|uniref:Ankyrin repeat-containing domain protein n=1 Tax=Massariosphaeria phaeospora TaxID=100035 RepID=A0A7C8MN70_9PLEO|nr:ankyrin repeat-containing domain protein [Massariosphaeria phaeospora]
MAASSWSSKDLIALCKNSDHEQLLNALQQPAAVEVALSHEKVVDDGCYRLNKLNLERMLVAAVRADDDTMVETLLKFGQKQDVKVDAMLTTEVIMRALDKSALPLIRKLEVLDPNIFTRYLSPGFTILMLASDGGPFGEKPPCNTYLPLMQYMMERGVDPNCPWIAKAHGPGTVLYQACRTASSKIVECLLKHGAIVAGSGAARVAAEHGRIKVLKLLLQYGADLNECFDTQPPFGPLGTALHTATYYRRDAVIEWLLEHGADPSIRNSEGKAVAGIVPVTLR